MFSTEREIALNAMNSSIYSLTIYVCNRIVFP